MGIECDTLLLGHIYTNLLALSALFLSISITNITSNILPTVLIERKYLYLCVVKDDLLS